MLLKNLRCLDDFTYVDDLFMRVNDTEAEPRILIDTNGTVIAGHALFLAYKKKRCTTVYSGSRNLDQKRGVVKI